MHVAVHRIAGLILCLCSTAFAAPPLDEWREDVQRVRELAERDGPAGYRAAILLQQARPPDATPADQARILNVLARTEIYVADTVNAERHIEQAQALAKAHDDRIGQAEADLNIALNSINQGRIDLMQAAAAHSLTVLEGVNRPDLLTEAMLRAGMMFRRAGQIEESVTMAMQAMEVAQHSNNALALAYAHQGLGVSFHQSYRYKEAREHFEDMLKYARAAPSRLLEASALQGLADTEAASGDLKGAEPRFREVVQIHRNAGMPFYLAHALFGLAGNLREQGRLQEALNLLGEIEGIYRPRNNRIGLWNVLNMRSEVQQRLSNMKAALDDAQQAYETAQAIGFPQYVAGSAQRMAALEAARGNYRRAYEYEREAAGINSRFAQEKSSARMLELTRHYEQQAQHRAIEELRYRNELQTAELQQRALQQGWLWTVLSAVLIALAGTAFFLLRLRRSRDTIGQLNASLEQRVEAATAGLREQASYLRALIDTLPLMVWLKDTQGRYLAVNQATARTCGRPVDEMVGRTDAEVWPASFVETLHAHDKEVLAGEERRTMQTELPTSHGPVWHEIYKAPVIDGGTVLGLVGAARDVSERRAAEQARELALAEARRLAQQRSEFLAQMSHELRTPLNGILGFAQILKRDKPLTERQARGLRIIEQSGMHLLALINDILDLARIDAARLELHPTDVDLPGLLNVVSDIVRVKAEEKHVLFTRRLDDRLPATVHVDEKRLRQVLLNLLSNAVKFTDRGEVTMAVRLLDSTAGTARVHFEIEDSGIGMDEEQLGRLFQPFEQVGDASHREGGTGLGLAISRQLVRLMGGDVAVRSEAGRGTCFWFDIDLPVVRSASAGPHPRGMPVGYEGRRRRILVVDDVAQNRAVLADGLSLLHFEVHEADDGARAIELAREFRPDLVVMDLTMPGMDGLTATRAIHALPGLGEVPVIATSGNATQQTRDDCERAGASAFIAKPINQEALLARIGELLGLHWLHEDAGAPAPQETWDAAGVPPLAPQDLEELARLVRMGSMRRICEHADGLVHRDPRYAGLGRQLHDLAGSCQSKGLVRLIEQLRVTTAVE